MSRGRYRRELPDLSHHVRNGQPVERRASYFVDLAFVGGTLRLDSDVIHDADRIVVLAGQCPLDSHGNLVGCGDVLSQTDQVVANSIEALYAAGTHAGHVVRSVIYVVSDDSRVLAGVRARLNESALGPAFTTASTLLGVAVRGYSGQLVEIDLTAAMP